VKRPKKEVRKARIQLKRWLIEESEEEEDEDEEEPEDDFEEDFDDDGDDGDISDGADILEDA